MLKVLDLVILNNALFMYNFRAKLLPPVFKSVFTSVDRLHQYNTRLASKRSYYLPKIRTYYGNFNIRFLGVKIWNSVQHDFKSKSRNSFKRLLTIPFLTLAYFDDFVFFFFETWPFSSPFMFHASFNFCFTALWVFCLFVCFV